MKHDDDIVSQGSPPEEAPATTGGASSLTAAMNAVLKAVKPLDALIKAQNAACRGGEHRQNGRCGNCAAQLARKDRALGKKVSLGLKLQPVFVADQNDRTFLEMGIGHGRHPQSRAPVSLWIRICRAVPSLS